MSKLVLNICLFHQFIPSFVNSEDKICCLEAQIRLYFMTAVKHLRAQSYLADGIYIKLGGSGVNSSSKELLTYVSKEGHRYIYKQAKKKP